MVDYCYIFIDYYPSNFSSQTDLVLKMEMPKDKTPVVIIGDVVGRLKNLKEKNIQVDTIITSPPYWGQRDYGVEGQIGSEVTPDKYVQNMLIVADHLRAILKDSGSFFLNIGDK